MSRLRTLGLNGKEVRLPQIGDDREFSGDQTSDGSNDYGYSRKIIESFCCG
jgi:hypothetical protein